jgi:D-glycero-D-manno-heptose 1,7-bisphosphate phosphatase
VLNRPFLHEDGKTHPPSGPEELDLLEGVNEACVALRQAGFLLIVVTNQPDVARGTQSREVVEAIHAKLRDVLPLDDVFVCYHDDGDRCACRKPEPGLLLSAARDWSIDLSASFMVGDRWTDVEAGRRSGCRTVFVGNGDADTGAGNPDHRAGSLVEAVDWILGVANL